MRWACAQSGWSHPTSPLTISHESPSAMELDELKSIWQRVEQTLERQESLTRQQMRSACLTRARHGLRPLFWGQILQILFGIPVILLGVWGWTSQIGVPHRMAPGLIVHVYGVLLIMFGGIVLSKISAVDYSAPVAEIQKKMALIEFWYIRTGLAVGLVWWVMWIPFTLVVFSLLGADLVANAPVLVWGNTVAGLLGLLATWCVHRWIHQPSRSKFAEWVDRGAAGVSLNKARQILEEATQFERE